MKRATKAAVLAAAAWLSACGQPQQADVKQREMAVVQLRTMIAQSALMAAQAACSEKPARGELVGASVVLLRRATAGPEMGGLHVMMGGDMNMDQPGGTEGKGLPQSAQTPQHIAIHAAGGALFDLLDALSINNGPSCNEIRPVAVAAGSVLLRPPHEQTGSEVTLKLNQDMDSAAARLMGMVKDGGEEGPATVRKLVANLEQM